MNTDPRPGTERPDPFDDDELAGALEARKRRVRR